ncbi:MAG: hypothetical protein IPO21_11645 [Bacteroidales bacterium]|jgi:hypothetical protein|nr:hypothetical protein [Bacteroidales bacterium]
MENAVKYYSENNADEAILLWNESGHTLSSSWTLSKGDQNCGIFTSDRLSHFEIVCPPNFQFGHLLNTEALLQEQNQVILLIQKICEQWAKTGNIGDITDFPIFGSSECTLG